MWDDLTAALTSTYRVFRYDARGHGASTVTDGDYSWDLLVGDIASLLDQIEIKR